MSDQRPQTEPTKTVDGYFGPKQVTRADFVKQWKSHFVQLFHLTSNVAEHQELCKMEQRIGELAGARWDKLK